jgi:hypothetical protein
MRSIERKVLFGSVSTQLMILEPHGAAGVYQVYIDKYYKGTISKTAGKWVGHLSYNTDLTADDIQALGEFIEEEGWLDPHPGPPPGQLWSYTAD